MREHVLTITKKDLRRETFRAGGPGGQNQNKRDTGVRFVHEPSGAVGESREARTQEQNEKLAFERLTKHHKFLAWVNAIVYNTETVVDEAMRSENLVIETRRDGKWERI